MPCSRVNIGGVWIDNVTMQETLDTIERLIAQKKPCYITGPNVDIIVRYNSDKEFANYYDHGALCLADGVPVLWMANLLGTPLKEKVSGSDLVPRVCELADQKGYRLFFLGGRPGAADAAKEKLHRNLKNLNVVGTYSPPFGFEKDENELQKISEMIKESKPDILFVGLGAPKQERWIQQYYQELGVPVSMGVGVTFEFIAGMVKRAPRWMQKAGLEWFWRLLMEPRRLWRRYLVDDLRFFGLILRQRINFGIISIFSVMLFFFPCPVYALGDHWEFAGWYGGGCFPNIVFDPHVKDRVYLTSDVAGIWRSDDLGDHWYFVTRGLGNLMVAQVTVAPSDSNVLYAATGGGVFVSRDAGGSWTQADLMNHQITFARPGNYRPIAVDSQNPNKLCVGTSKGKVFCSQDSGARWRDLDPDNIFFPALKPISAIAFDSRENLYVASAEGLSRCAFDGGGCEKFKNGPTRITDFLLSSKSAGTLYVAGEKRLWVSHDGGDSWSQSQSIAQGNTYRVALDESVAGLIIRVIWNKDWNGGVLVSKDEGKTWESQDSNLHGDEISNPTRVWAAKGGKSTSIQVDPFDPNVVFRTDWWGVWRSNDGGASWNEKIVGAPNTVATQVVVASNGDVYVAGMDNGLLRSRNGGKTYEALFPKRYDPAASGHLWRVAVLGNAIIATSSPWNQMVNQLIVSLDEGKTFDFIRQGLPSQRPQGNTMWAEGYPRALAVDWKNPNTIYLGMDGDDGGGLFVSKNQGRTWSRSKGQPGALRIYNGLAVDPTDSNRIVWGACGQNGGVYVSQDAGKSFQYVFKEMLWVFDVAIGSDGAMYAAGDSGGAKLFASVNHGSGWKMIGDFGKDRALGTVVVDPRDPKRIAVSTVHWTNGAPCRIFLTADGGKNWRDITGDLPDGAGASSIAFAPEENYLYIARSAASVYRLFLAG